MKQQDMFVVLVFLEVERAYQDDMRAALITYARMCIEREPGCRRYDVCLDPVDGTAFLLYQVYDDEAAYLQHRELPHYAEFRILADPWTRSRRVLTYEGGRAARTPLERRPDPHYLRVVSREPVGCAGGGGRS